MVRVMSVGSNEGDESGDCQRLDGWQDGGQDRETDICEIMTLTIIRNL